MMIRKQYIVECRLVDESAFIRPDPPFVDYPVASVKWVVNKKDEVKEPGHSSWPRRKMMQDKGRRKVAGRISVCRYQKSFPRPEVRIVAV